MGPCHYKEFIHFVGSRGKPARIETQRIQAKYFPALSSIGINCMVSKACCQSITRSICFSLLMLVLNHTNYIITVHCVKHAAVLYRWVAVDLAIMSIMKRHKLNIKMPMN